MPFSARTRALSLAAVFVITASLLSGCSAGTSIFGAPISPTATATVPAAVNDLAKGTTKKLLTAGAISIDMTYWSELPMDKWTAKANKSISFSLVTSVAGGGTQAVYLSKVSVVSSVSGPNGQLASPVALEDTATVSPGYLVKTPYSYTQTFIIPAVDARATQLVLSFTYQLLLQSTPTSAQYAKQTATDSISVAIAQR